ncbi:diphthine synthase, partial [mine drainage metagenome]
SSLQVRALEALGKCTSIYVETYTSGSRENLVDTLRKALGKEVTLLPREKVEQSRMILNSARTSDTAFLVQGDALTATTHNQVRIDSMAEGIDVIVLENSSIITAIIGYLGLQIYKLGQVVSLPFVTERFFPRSPYDKILGNMERGLHTMLLLDITETGYMSVPEACSILERMNERFGNRLDLDAMKIAVVHAYGTGSLAVRYGKMADVCKAEYTQNPSTIVIPGKLDFYEKQFISHFAIG